MGSRTHNIGSTVFIEKDRLNRVFDALRDLPLPSNGWVTRREVLRSLDMKDILNAWGHNPRYDEQGNVTAVYWVWEGEDEELFTLLYTAIAPFVRAGSVQEYRDDYGNIWRWYFNGTRAVRQTGRVVYEDDPEDATPSDGGRPWAT